MKLFYPDGATPLDGDELEGLIPEHVTKRGELNELEQQNILIAEEWISRANIKRVTEEAFLRRLHKQMFGEVWRWAGNFRTTDKNIGVAPHRIAVDLLNLRRDIDEWLMHQVFPPDEIATRFHHRLVSIHPFPNGNGRHARLAADILLERVLKRPRFTWGNDTLLEAGQARTTYITALRAADVQNYEPLLQFVRS